MVRKFRESKLVLATTNTGKKKEILDLLSPFGVEIIFGDNILVDAPEEIGRTFCENAQIKAEAYQIEGCPVLADDSGLVVSSLEGRLGINSARFAEECGGYPNAFKTLEEQLKNQPDKRAYFECCLVLLWPEGHGESFSGRVDGQLTFPPRGHNGHGYDPIFQPLGETRTFGEMRFEEKQSLSHRSKALNQMIQQCFN